MAKESVKAIFSSEQTDAVDPFFFFLQNLTMYQAVQSSENPFIVG